MGTDTT